MPCPEILTLEDADSTNRIAQDLIEQRCVSGTVVRALRQSGGRGQYGRSFSSPDGGLYFSLVLRPDIDPKRLSLITLTTGFACREVLHRECGLAAMIKWPNDLYLADRKVGGILCESRPDPDQAQPGYWVIVGVGLNVNSMPEDFPAELQPLLTTLRVATGRRFDCDALLKKLLHEITTQIGRLHQQHSAVLHQWQSYDYLFGKEIIHTAGTVRIAGRGQGIDGEGGYQLLDAAGHVHRIIGGQLQLSSAKVIPPPC
jgi:BirA family biotin operon repressor/biotin-[acetyl-CoA-carboxylase] ligase